VTEFCRCHWRGNILAVAEFSFKVSTVGPMRRLKRGNMSFPSDSTDHLNSALEAGSMPVGFQLDLLRLNLGLARQSPRGSAPETEAHERAVETIRELARCA
jgi:hypothetical protein